MKNTLVAPATALALGLPLATVALADGKVNIGNGGYDVAPYIDVAQIIGDCKLANTGAMVQIVPANGGYDLPSDTCSVTVDGSVATQSLYSPIVIEYATVEIGGEQG